MAQTQIKEAGKYVNPSIPGKIFDLPAGSFISEQYQPYVPPTSLATPTDQPQSPVSSSTDFRNEVTNLQNDLTQVSANAPKLDQLTGTIYDTAGLEQQKTDSNDFYGARRKELEARRQKEVERLTAEGEATQRGLETKQKGETATTSRNIAYIGGYLGDSASGQGVLQNLEQIHKQEVTDLFSKRQAAIAQAQNAFNDSDFELAKAQMQEAKDIDKEVYQRQKDYADYTKGIREESRQLLQLQYNMGAEQRAINQSKLQHSQQLSSEMLRFSLDNNVQQPFFEYAGTVFDSATGEIISNKEDALARGVKPDFSNVQKVVLPPAKKDYAPGIIGEYEYYVAEQQKLGKQPVDFNTFQNMDANRKAKVARAGASITTTYNLSKEKDFDAAKAATGDALRSVSGGDGYVAEGDYKRLRTGWVAQGYSSEDFDKQFSGFVNPKYAESYGVKYRQTGVNPFGG